MQFTVTAEHDGCLLRTYLQRHLQLSTRLIRALKRHPDGMLLNGQPVTVTATLHTGQLLQLAVEQLVPAHPGTVVPSPCALPLSILYEDEDIIVCNKPADMPTHPSHGHFTDTLANALAYRYGNGDTPFVFHPVNRLDRNTSGAVLVARHALSAQRLGDAMAARAIQKSYLALVCGKPAQPDGEIVTGIRRRQESVITREICEVDAPGADLARTHYQTLATFSTPSEDGMPHTVSLLRAHPLTGRTHQLRLHFAHIGTPILGDDLYGTGVFPPHMLRHALHSHTLQFPHPRSGAPMLLTAPLPEDIASLLPIDIVL